MAISSERAKALGTDAHCAPASSDETSSSSGAERRRHVRHALQVEARVGFDGGASRACQIQDVCAGGLFLAVAGANGIVVGDKTLERDDGLVVQFSTEADGCAQKFEVTVRVARVIAGGMGVSFEGRNSAAIRALNNLLKKSMRARAQATVCAVAVQGMPDDVVDVADASNILAAYRHRVAAFLESNLAALFEHAKDSLFAAARGASDPEEQSAFFDAIQELDGLREPVQTAFPNSIASQLQQLEARLPGAEALASADSTVDVALVDTGTFDDWVVIKDIISRATPNYRERQQEIAARLSKLLNLTVEDDNNPVGLTRIGLAFHDAIQNLGAGHACRQAILRSFEETIVSGLGALYDDLCDILCNREVSFEVERTAADRPVSVKQDNGTSAEPAGVEAAAPAVASESELRKQKLSKPRF